MNSPPLEISGLTVEYQLPSGRVRALDGVSLRVEAGEAAALVGASGSGKTTIARAASGLLPDNAAILAGSISVAGRDMTRACDAEWCRLRGAHVGMIFQEPASALHPMLTIEMQVGEALDRHGLAAGAARRARVLEALEEAGLPDAAARLRDRPHRLSGGMRQRAAIAAALTARPKILFADEPTTALDAVLRMHIVALLEKYQREHSMSIVWITHDLAAVARRASQMIVLSEGRVVESGPPARVAADPRHPYTRALVAAAAEVR